MIEGELYRTEQGTHVWFTPDKPVDDVPGVTHGWTTKQWKATYRIKPPEPGQTTPIILQLDKGE